MASRITSTWVAVSLCAFGVLAATGVAYREAADKRQALERLHDVDAAHVRRSTESVAAIADFLARADAIDQAQMALMPGTASAAVEQAVGFVSYMEVLYRKAMNRKDGDIKAREILEREIGPIVDKALSAEAAQLDALLQQLHDRLERIHGQASAPRPVVPGGGADGPAAPSASAVASGARRAIAIPPISDRFWRRVIPFYAAEPDAGAPTVANSAGSGLGTFRPPIFSIILGGGRATVELLTGLVRQNARDTLELWLGEARSDMHRQARAAARELCLRYKVRPHDGYAPNSAQRSVTRHPERRSALVLS